MAAWPHASWQQEYFAEEFLEERSRSVRGRETDRDTERKNELGITFKIIIPVTYVLLGPHLPKFSLVTQIESPAVDQVFNKCNCMEYVGIEL